MKVACRRLMDALELLIRKPSRWISRMEARPRLHLADDERRAAARDEIELKCAEAKVTRDDLITAFNEVARHEPLSKRADLLQTHTFMRIHT